MDPLEAKKQAKQLQPLINIGKAGITPGMIDEISRQVKRQRLVKVRFLKSYAPEKDLASDAVSIAVQAKALLVDQIGRVFVLLKRKGL